MSGLQPALRRTDIRNGSMKRRRAPDRLNHLLDVFIDGSITILKERLVTGEQAGDSGCVRIGGEGGI